MRHRSTYCMLVVLGIGLWASATCQKNQSCLGLELCHVVSLAKRLSSFDNDKGWYCCRLPIK